MKKIDNVAMSMLKRDKEKDGQRDNTLPPVSFRLRKKIKRVINNEPGKILDLKDKSNLVPLNRDDLGALMMNFAGNLSTKPNVLNGIKKEH